MAKISVGKLTFEDALGRLEKIIDQIESGETGLEDALKQYESGSALITRCRAILDKAETRIGELTAQGPDGLKVADRAD